MNELTQDLHEAKANIKTMSFDIEHMKSLIQRITKLRDQYENFVSSIETKQRENDE